MRLPPPFRVSPRLVRYGFGDDAEPRRRIPARMIHPALPGHFPTGKSATGLVRTSSPLMMDGLLHLDTDPLAVRLAPFPVEIHWWAGEASGEPSKRSLIPDVGVAWRGGALSFHRFVPLAIQAENPSFEAESEQLRRVFAEEHDAAYSVLDERDLHVRPRFENLRIMWRHQLGDLDPGAIDAVRLALERRRRRGEGATIGELKADCALKDLWSVFEGGAPPRRLEGADRVFSAVMTLAMAGEVALDLSRALGDASAVLPGVLTADGSAR